jgi:hypothetical protein
MDNVLHFALAAGPSDRSARLDAAMPAVSSAGSRYSVAPGVKVGRSKLKPVDIRV